MTSLFKGRNLLNDIFSEFRKFISPTYYHDRCERSLNMALYSMHKRDILLILTAFFASFILLLFIGLAGPNVTKFDSIRAQDLFNRNKLNESIRENLLETGPFILSTPPISVYSEYLRLWVTIYLKEEDETEAFHKQFYVSLRIIAKNDLREEKVLLNEYQLNLDHKQKFGRVHKLICVSMKCNPIEILHLEYLEFSSYTIEIKFQDLHTINEKYKIKDILFTFQSINSSFTNLTIWFRFFFLVTSFICTCWFTYSLQKYNFADWSIEQKWISILLVFLILYDNPFYPMVYLFGSKYPRLIEIIFQNSFFLLLIFFWLTFYHGIRQNNRPFGRFYGPKVLLVGSMWLIIIYSFNWSITLKLEKPTIDEQLVFDSSFLLKLLKVLFYALFFVTIIYLILLILTAFSELLTMPYFDLRLKLQTFLIIFVVTIFVLISVLSSSSNNPKEISELDVPKISYLQILPWMMNSSSASFLAIYSLANLYVFLCAYFYSPSFSSFADSRIVRDNPTLSMINDSDEDIIFNMDFEGPLSKLIETKNEDSD